MRGGLLLRGRIHGAGGVLTRERVPEFVRAGDHPRGILHAGRIHRPDRVRDALLLRHRVLDARAVRAGVRVPELHHPARVQPGVALRAGFDDGDHLPRGVGVRHTRSARDVPGRLLQPRGIHRAQNVCTLVRVPSRIRDTDAVSGRPLLRQHHHRGTVPCARLLRCGSDRADAVPQGDAVRDRVVGPEPVPARPLLRAARGEALHGLRTAGVRGHAV